jgi:hypothetical protein
MTDPTTELKPYTARQRAYRKRVKRGEIVLAVTVECDFMERLLASNPAQRAALAEQCAGLLAKEYRRRMGRYA